MRGRGHEQAEEVRTRGAGAGRADGLRASAQYDSQWAAIRSIAEKVGCTAETLRTWVRRAKLDTGRKPGATTDERERVEELEREVRELKRANEILRKASVESTSAYFAQAELDRRPR